MEKTGVVLLERYELCKKIGAGGSGAVYLAWDRHLERFVAVKEELRTAETESFAKDGDFLREEMKMLKALQHPMLPAVYDYFGETEQYLVMEYIPGESLHNFIEREGAVPEGQACQWALQLLNLLSYLHARKPPVIYRDLKPANIILCPDGNLRVVDFGAARQACYDGRRPEHLAGTAGYAAPEQLCGKADERSDLYTLGATLYHMLTGHDPGRPPYGLRPVRSMRPEVSQELEWIVAKCTGAEPVRRYQTAEELRKDLEKRKFSGRKFFFRRFGSRKRHVLRRMEKKIWLTEKRNVGLFTAGILLCTFTALVSIQAMGREKPLPVIVYNRQGQKVVIRYDSVYTPDGNLLLELKQELFGEEGIQELSVGLTDCETGKRRERIFYIRGGSGGEMQSGEEMGK